MKNLITRLFDLKKKWDMEKMYKNTDTWGRSKQLDQISSAVKMIPDKRYRRCLDVGTGLGYFAESVAGICDEVIAVDISDIAIVRARKRLYGVNIQFLEGNIRTIEFEKGFDLIILGEVLYYLGDKLMPSKFYQVLKQFYELLYDHGRILITHHVIPKRDKRWFYAKYLEPLKTMGMIVEKEEEFKQNGKLWLHAVLKK